LLLRETSRKTQYFEATPEGDDGIFSGMLHVTE
jgi:hypothetical protein